MGSGYITLAAIVVLAFSLTPFLNFWTFFFAPWMWILLGFMFFSFLVFKSGRRQARVIWDGISAAVILTVLVNLSQYWKEDGVARQASIASVVKAGPEIMTAGQFGRLAIYKAGENSVRVTLAPLRYEKQFPYSPALLDRDYPKAALSLREVKQPVTAQIGNLQAEVLPDPLTVKISTLQGRLVQQLIFKREGQVSFKLDDQPVLGMGEGGPVVGENWRDLPVQFDRRGAFDEMNPRAHMGPYGSRNPVGLLIGTSGWGLFVPTPWGSFDLRGMEEGIFSPWQPPPKKDTERMQGRPPLGSVVPGVYDIFVFDAEAPEAFMKDAAFLTSSAVMPPKWSLGYMQSHRTLEDDRQLLKIVETFREKRIPIDAVIYLGTGFTPRGWNKKQPSFEFNPEVFTRAPEKVIRDLHDRHVKVVLHMVPWHRDKLPTLKGSIPPLEGEAVDQSHILSYWKQHVPLLEAGADAFWPDEGDWFDLFERMKRHQLYFEGPLSTRENVRPWSLHRNGHLGIARWGGWVWSGDPNSSWKTLEAQIAVGINHSLSLSPYWGSDIGGFIPGEELTGELYARWFQFGAFTPSFRSHGRTWWTRLPWGWGLSEMGPIEAGKNPLPSELNNPAIEPICKKYAELRYRLMPYTYTLTREAFEKGMPLMRAMWLHYPDDNEARVLGSQYLWGKDMLVAPVFSKGARTRRTYLPQGYWYDWWTNEKFEGARTVEREVDLGTMPLYVRAGAIIPFDPVRQYTSEKVKEPVTIKVYSGADGEFRWYEDDGESLGYQQKKYSWTKLHWNDKDRTLTISPDEASGALKPAARQLVIELLPEGLTQKISYGGKEKAVSFRK